MMRSKQRGISTSIVVITVVALAVATAGVFIAYRENQAFQKTELRVEGAGIPDISLTKISIPLEVKFYNDSAYDSPPISVTYDILVNEKKVGKGKIPQTSVSAGSTAETTQTVTLKPENVGSALFDALSSGAIRVRIEGEKKTKLLLGLIPISKDFKSTHSFGA